jgi:FG-GAP repeat/LVIVD repeat
MKLQFLIAALFFLTTAHAQNVGIGITTPDSSAILDLSSTSKGVLVPRMTSAQRKAITSPTRSLMVFDTDKNCFYYFDGEVWVPMLFATSEEIPTVKWEPADGMPGDKFGRAVCISGDYAIIGADQDEEGGNVNQGSAYIYEKSNGFWTMKTKLLANDGAASDRFGFSVSISGNYAIIGSINSNNNEGAAYIFFRDNGTWVQQSKLAIAGSLNIAESVSISGDYAIISDPQSTVGSNPSQGCAWIYTRIGTSWTQQAQLISNTGVAGGNFGSTVSISGDDAVAGYPSENSNVGCTYVFVRNGNQWNEQTRFCEPNNQPALFGWSVTISGNTIIVKKLFPQPELFVFTRTGTTWSLEQELYVPNLAFEPGFASSISLSGDYLIVGCDGAKVYSYDPGSNNGAALIFKRTGVTWSLVRIVRDPAGSGGHALGFSVSINGNDILVGAPNASSNIPFGGYNPGKGRVLFLNIEE